MSGRPLPAVPDRAVPSYPSSPFARSLPDWTRDVVDPRDAHLQWGKSRDVAWDAVLDGHLSANTFLLKSALTRKADLARTLARHRESAGPDAPAVRATPETIVIDPFDDDLSDAEEEKDEKDATGPGPGPRRVGIPADAASRGGRWALKASDANRGENIVFLDAKSPADIARAERAMRANGDTSSAAWVLQRYVEPPMLRLGVYKFHLRAHVLAVGDLDAWVHDDIVALCAAAPYRGASTADTRAHATNLCARKRREKKETAETKEAAREREAEAVATLEELCASVPLPTSSDGSTPTTPETFATRIRSAIREVAADLFLAARGRAGGALGFFPTAGCFELFGLDFLLDEKGDARLLEVNSDPSLAVFGERLKDTCARTIADILDVALPEVRRARGFRKDDVDETTAETTRRGGFELVARTPPRFEGDVDGAVGRRKLAALVSVAGAIARGEPRGDESSNGKPRRRRVAFALGDSRGAVGARRALERAGWRVESAVRDAPECAFQWAPHGSIRWDRVMEETGGEMTNGFATKVAFATTANHHFARAGLTRKGADFFAEELEKRSGSESGWRRARVFALVAGAKPRVELRRGSLVGLSAEEAEEARPAVADAVVRAVDVAKAKSGFLPFRNCFEVYATTLDVRRKSDGKWEARATRFEDAFESPSCFVAARGTEEDSESESAAAEDAEEDSESDSALAEDAEEDSESDSALAEDAVVTALECFYPGEFEPSAETRATRGFEVVRA